MSITYDRTRSGRPRGTKGAAEAAGAEQARPSGAVVAPGPGSVPFGRLSADERLALAYGRLESIRQINGGYMDRPAAPSRQSGPDAAVESSPATGSVRIVDNLFATYAEEYVGAHARAAETARLVVGIFERHAHAIRHAACAPHSPGSPASRPVPHSVHPATLDSLDTAHAGLSLPVFGLFLLRVGELIGRGLNVVPAAERPAVSVMLRDTLLFLETAGWRTDPDFGLWGYSAAQRPSSVASVVAGLGAWRPEPAGVGADSASSLSEMLPVPPVYIEQGRAELERFFRSEPSERHVGMDLLGLVWPYAVVDSERAAGIIRTVENELVRSRGVIRYPGDGFMRTGEGGEAQWPVGFAWLSIACSDTAGRIIRASGPTQTTDELISKAERHLDRLESVMAPDGRVPEYFRGGVEGHAEVRTWPQGLYVVARKALERVHEAMGWR